MIDEQALTQIEARWDARAVGGWTTEQAVFAATVGAPTDVWLLVSALREAWAEIARLKESAGVETD